MLNLSISHLYFSYFCLFTFFHKSQTYPIQFIDEEWDPYKDVRYIGARFVTRGSDLTITCQMSRYKAPSWSLNDVQLKVHRNSRYKTDSIEGSSSSRMEQITIHNVGEDDEGYYRCNSDSRNSHFVNVLPQDSDKVIIERFNTTEKTFQNISQNQNVLVLKCSLPFEKSTSDIQWYKKGVLIGPDMKHKFHNEKMYMFILNATSHADSGQYRCSTERDNNFYGHTIDVNGKFKLSSVIRENFLNILNMISFIRSFVQQETF